MQLFTQPSRCYLSLSVMCTAFDIVLMLCCNYLCCMYQCHGWLYVLYSLLALVSDVLFCVPLPGKKNGWPDLLDLIHATKALQLQKLALYVCQKYISCL